MKMVVRFCMKRFRKGGGLLDPEFVGKRVCVVGVGVVVVVVVVVVVFVVVALVVACCYCSFCC